LCCLFITIILSQEITESGTTTFAPNTFEWFVSGPIEPVNDLFKEILGKNPLLSQNIIGNSASFHKILKRLQAIVRGMRSRAELAKGMLDVGSTTPNKVAFFNFLFFNMSIIYTCICVTTIFL
jgi:hypothetical protein